LTNQRIAFFGSSLLSAYWNGAATYYRGIIRALHARGYDVTFFEPDAYDRQQHRDIVDPPPWVNVYVYPGNEAGVSAALELARDADWIIKASGVGLYDELLEREVLAARRNGAGVAFWDVDAPATLDRMQANPTDPFRQLVPKYDVIFTYGGGEPVKQAYRRFGAAMCVPIYNALDPSTHYPAEPNPSFAADLSFVGNRLPDREARVEEFFLKPASELSNRRFLLAGSGWGDKNGPANVSYVGHLYSTDHNAFNCSATAVLNVSRDSMAKYGFSPATRVFEAAGAGACVISDAWEGIEMFFEPSKEILVAASGDEVANMVRELSPDRSRAIGEAALARVLREHTYSQRAEKVDAVFEGQYASVGQ
jgi:spore maturation protein CgeB